MRRDERRGRGVFGGGRFRGWSGGLEFAQLLFQQLGFGLPAITTSREVCDFPIEFFGPQLLLLGSFLPSVATFAKHSYQFPW